MHHPVLLHEVIEALSIKPGNRYIDATAGEGGHCEEIIKKGGDVLAIDWDENQVQNLKSKLKDLKNCVFACGNFAQIERIAHENNFVPVDGILFDLGLSMAQMKKSGKGFSYQGHDEPLDMRINAETKTAAQEIVNTWSENELYEAFATNSEDIHSRDIARSIVRARSKKRIEASGELAHIISQTVKMNTKKTMARIFQALRMAVNHERENLKSALEGSVKILAPGGKVAVITFHSVEDRLVKQFITNHHLNGIRIQKKRPLSFERSATLRVFSREKL